MSKRGKLMVSGEKLIQALGGTSSDGPAWETSSDGFKYLRTPRDQALVLTSDVDVHQIEFFLIEPSKELRESKLLREHAVGEGIDWSKPLYEEITPAMFRNVDELLAERECQIATLTALNFQPKRSSMGLLFAVEADARAAILAVHTALWRDAQLRLPLWAHHALRAGWTQPEGWQP